MQSKQIILIVIIVAALAGAGVFLYLSFSGKGTPTGTNQPAAISPILPHGTSLNFDKVNKFNQTGRTFQYPTVNPGETGPALNDIITQN